LSYGGMFAHPTNGQRVMAVRRGSIGSERPGMSRRGSRMGWVCTGSDRGRHGTVGHAARFDVRRVKATERARRACVAACAVRNWTGAQRPVPTYQVRRVREIGMGPTATLPAATKRPNARSPIAARLAPRLVPRCGGCAPPCAGWAGQGNGLSSCTPSRLEQFPAGFRKPSHDFGGIQPEHRRDRDDGAVPDG